MKRTELKRGTGFKSRSTPMNRGKGFAPPAKPMQRTAFKPGKSLRQKLRDAIYFPLRDIYMAAHEFCERCGKLAADLHHKARKIGENYYRHFMAVCRECHDWIESHTAAARKLGYLITDNPRRVD